MPIVVTGAGAGSGLEPTAEPRLEIRKLMEDKMQWSLYVQAVGETSSFVYISKCTH
jgi:hypothetical protein